jgi:hypothetical protein
MVEITLPFFESFTNTVFTILAPIINLLFFICILGFTFIFFKFIYKLYLLLSLGFNVIYSYWINYNKNILKIPSYQNKIVEPIDILEKFKVATSFW